MPETDETAGVYVHVRTDLPLADQMVQVGHVCLEAARRFDVPPHTRLILLSVPDEPALLRTVDDLRYDDVDVVTFYEPDAVDDASLHAMGVTAACTAPVTRRQARRLRRHRLWTASR